MIVSQYEVRFQEFSRYDTMILPIEEERIYFFMHGLIPQLRIGNNSLVTLSQSYLDIVDHAYYIELFSRKAQEESTNMLGVGRFQ